MTLADPRAAEWLLVLVAIGLVILFIKWSGPTRQFLGDFKAFAKGRSDPDIHLRLRRGSRA